MRTATIALTILLFASSWAVAQPSLLKGATDSTVPIEVDSERMELRSKENIIVFSGSVVSRRADVNLSCDRLVVYMTEGGEDVEKIEAQGNVRIRKGDILVAGERAVFIPAQESFLITGQPRMWRGRDVVEGDSILLNLVDESVEVEGARIIMFPGDSAAEGEGASDK